MASTKILIKRGLEANRLSITPASGELIYTTDTHKLYMGDGTTAGGLLIDPGAGVYIPESEKGQASGVATLGTDGKIPSTQLPPIALTDTFVVASEAEMLALTAQPGDVAVRTDESKSYILQGTDPTSLGSWVHLQTPDAPVSSVNGKTGTVVLSTDDVAEGTNNLYYTSTRAETDANNAITNRINDGLPSTSGLYSSSKIESMVQGALQYKGAWDASTNTPTLSDSTGTQNDWYKVSVAGTQDLGSGSIEFFEGDDVIHNGTIWQRFGDSNVVHVLDDLQDVSAPAPTDGQVIQFVASTSKWQAVTPVDNDTTYTAGTGISIDAANNNAINLDATLNLLNDVSGTPTDNQALVFTTGGGWTPKTIQFALGELTDVDTTGATTGQVLKFNGTSWAPADDLDTTVATLNDIGDVTITSVTAGQGIVWDTATSKWVNGDLTTSFVALSDTPNAYASGDAGKFVRVNASENAVEFTTAALNDLSDVDTTGAATNSILKYNGTSWVVGFDVDTTYTGGTNITIDSANNNAINWAADLGDLGNVNTAGASDGQVLKYVIDDQGNSSWVPGNTTDTTYTAGTGISIDSANNNAINLDAGIDLLNDVTVDSATLAVDDYLKWDGTKWVNTAPQTVSLDDLDDVDTTTTAPANTNLLQFNGTNWVPVAVDSVGRTTFVALSDTPTSYTGMAGYGVRVNSTENGLEFVDVSTIDGGTF